MHMFTQKQTWNGDSQFKPAHSGYIVRTLSCIFGILIFFQTSFSQTYHVEYKGKEIVPSNFKTLRIFDRVYLLTTLEKDPEKMNAFIEPLSVIDIDSMIAVTDDFIQGYKQLVERHTISLTMEQINERTKPYKEVNQILKKNRSSKLVKKATPAPQAIVDSSEILFVNQKLEDKMGSLAFMVNLDPLFDKLYALLTPSEKDSAIIATDDLMYHTQWLGEKLNHPQKVIDKEMKYYIELKNKLKEIQAKK